MQRARLAIGVLIGCAVFTPGKVWAAEEAVAAPAAAPAAKVRQVTLTLKQTPLKKALQQVFVPGTLKIAIEADVPPLALNLTLKDVEEDVAFRLVMRQAKKQFPDLDFAPTDDGYRIFVAVAAKQDEKPNPYPLTALPKVLAPPSPDFPRVQNREVEPLIAQLYGRAENGEPLLAPPGDLRGLDPGYGADPLASGPGYADPYGYGANGYGGYGNGGYNGYANYDSYLLDRYNLRRDLGRYDLDGLNLDPNGAAYRLLQRGGIRDRRSDPYSSPTLGGPGERPTVERPDEKKRLPHLPGPYGPTQWIYEPRTRFWGRPGNIVPNYHNPGKRKPTTGSPTSGGGGGYLPGGPR